MTDHQHVWIEEYYGWLCVPCGLFYPFGCAPWEAFDEFDDDAWDEDAWDTAVTERYHSHLWDTGR